MALYLKRVMFLLTGSEDGEGAVIIEPLQRGLIQLRLARGRHHSIERLKEGLDNDAKLKKVIQLRNILHWRETDMQL